MPAETQSVYSFVRPLCILHHNHSHEGSSWKILEEIGKIVLNSSLKYLMSS